MNQKAIGLAPGSLQPASEPESITTAIAACALGYVLVASSKNGLVAIFLGDNAPSLLERVEEQFPTATVVSGEADLEQVLARVVDRIESPRAVFDDPLDIRGTPFQQRVWNELQRIPPGITLSYAQLAQRLGMPKATRAVASACAANKLAVVVPCHRVVRSDGSLSGYRWGVERKGWLLERERRLT